MSNEVVLRKSQRQRADGSKVTKVSLELPEDHAEWLRQAAFFQRTTQTALINEILTDYRARHPEMPLLPRA